MRKTLRLSKLKLASEESFAGGHLTSVKSWQSLMAYSSIVYYLRPWFANLLSGGGIQSSNEYFFLQVERKFVELATDLLRLRNHKSDLQEQNFEFHSIS